MKTSTKNSILPIIYYLVLFIFIPCLLFSSNVRLNYYYEYEISNISERFWNESLQEKTRKDSIEILLAETALNPNNSSIRYNLIELLVAENLFNYAWEQIQYLSINNDEEPRYNELKILLSSKIDSNTRRSGPTRVSEKIISIIDSLIRTGEDSEFKNLINDLNSTNPNNPDLVKLAWAAELEVKRKQKEIKIAEIEKQINENIEEEAPKITPPTTTKTVAKNQIPFDFHKGLRFVPQNNFYSDNLDYLYFIAGASIEAGLNNFLGLGVSLQKGFLENNSKRIASNKIIGILYLRPNPYLLFSVKAGENTIANSVSQKELDINLKYEILNKLKMKISYFKNDAAIIFNSANLIETRLSADVLVLSGYYYFQSNVLIEGEYSLFYTQESNLSYLGIDRFFPENIGNSLLLNAYKQFTKYLAVGYEYYFSDFKFTLPLYFSPQDYQSQSIYTDWKLLDNKKIELNIKGKLGYLITEESMLKDIEAKFLYKFNNRFYLSIDGQLMFTKRYKLNYNYRNITLNIYWSLVRPK